MWKSRLLRIFYVVIFSINLGIFLAYVILWIRAAENQLFLQADLTAHYTGWMMIRDGYKTRLYDLELQRQYQQRILVDRSFSEGLLTYNYPPHTAQIFSFLARFSLINAYYIWSLFQILCFILFILSTYNILKSLSRNERALLFSTIVAFPPLFFNFMIGGLSLMMSLSAIKVYENLKNSRQKSAGIWWLLTTNKPQFAFFPMVIFFVTKRWKAVATATVSCIVLFILISMEFGWRIWLDYLQVLIRTSTQFGTYGINPKAMYNLKAILTLALSENNATWINLLSWIIFAAASCGIVFLWWGEKWQPQNHLLELKYALTLTLFIFTFPHVNAHDSLLLIVAASLFYKYLNQRSLSTTLFSVFILSWPLLFLISKFIEQITILSWIPPIEIAVLLAWQLRFWLKEKYPKPVVGGILKIV